MRINRISAGLAAIAAGALLIAGCSNPMESAGGDNSDSSSSGAVTISSANFVESEVLGNLFAETLRANDIEVETKFNIGSRESYIPATMDGTVDIVPEYTGNLLLYLDPESDMSSGADVDSELGGLLKEKNLRMLTPSEAENTDTMTVTKKLADKWNLKSIADLVPHNGELILAGMPEFNERSRGIPGLTELYGIEAAEFVAISDGGGPATVQALVDGSVHGANIFTTSPAVDKFDLVALEDPKGNFPKQNIIPLVNTDALTPEIEDALNSVTGKLTTDELRRLNTMVEGDEKLEPKEAALQWLGDQGLI